MIPGRFRKKMKRIKICILVLIVILTSVIMFGCSADINQSDNGRLKYYTYKEDGIFDIIIRYNSYCEEHYDESYKIEIVEFDSEEEMNLKVSTEIMSGGGPDIFSLNQNLPFEKMAQNKTLSDINKLIDLYDFDIGLDDCNKTVMDAGIIDGKRYFIPLYYSPDVFITTEETLEKYNLSSSDFSYKALSDELLRSKVTYSLFGSTDDNIDFFYSFLNQYIDFYNEKTEFGTSKFSDDLDDICNLINNDTTNENIYYFLYENIKDGVSILFNEDPSFYCLVRAYSVLSYLGSTPVLINSYTKSEDTFLSSVDVGLAISNNCKDKEKLLAFIKYCLLYDTQIGIPWDNYCLPVNNKALDYYIGISDEAVDLNDDGSFDDNEKAISKKARDSALKDYIYAIENTKECRLHSFHEFSGTHFNSAIIGDIVDKYLNGDITKDKFIRHLTAATEIYFTE